MHFKFLLLLSLLILSLQRKLISVIPLWSEDKFCVISILLDFLRFVSCPPRVWSVPWALEGMCVLPLLGGVFHTCEFHLLVRGVVEVVSILGDFLSTCSTHCCERWVEVSNHNCEFVYFSFHFYSFLFHIFCSRTKEIMQIRAQVNDLKNRKTIDKISDTKNLFFEKIDKTDNKISRPTWLQCSICIFIYLGLLCFLGGSIARFVTCEENREAHPESLVR